MSLRSGICFASISRAFLHFGIGYANIEGVAEDDFGTLSLSLSLGINDEIERKSQDRGEREVRSGR